MRFGELDAAIEWCEERIVSSGPIIRHAIALADHPVLAGLGADELAVVAGALAVRRWSAGESIVRRGDPADELFLLTSGELSVYVPLEGREPGRRLATLTAGMVLGEVSFLGGGTRTADVLADSDVEAWILDTTSFAGIRREHPGVAAALLENLYRILAGIAKRLTDEVASIAA
jgi:CRP-like cAMP-binding protein